MIDIRDNDIKKLIKAINSNLIRAHQEEDTYTKNLYLKLAGLYSCDLGELIKEDTIESSKYFLSGAYSFENSGDEDLAKMCYEKVIEIGINGFVNKAKEGLDRVK